ncbi:tape measure protein [Moorella sp. E306M]|uniref:tape measure protein n=1 Tax=Moorella sp. E306M TaxID=2572683 RepID=UPI0010FFB4E8|nr:tape measure protein [Moorella sp. E306M]GEA17494.1 hypothetical protein E306M_06280 [Moorella sp. E306M]
MASEVYRVEIPIIVDDQSEAPLERARERVSRLEKEARKRNEMIRKHFENVARLKIEPVMRIRDKLTAGVLKADRLVKMLGAEQAAPVLAAQDKVSAVVLRVNQLIDALEKNKVDVLADMKGPLIEEINEARTALVALSKVQSAPVAELRGKLFAQLTRAMAVARQLDQVRAEPQANLRERVITKAREIMSVLRGLTSRAWNITLGIKDTALGAVRRLTSIITSPLGLLGVGVGGAAAITGLIKAPLELAGNMEQARIGFTTMLGSAEKATAFVKDLQLFAAKTPFEFPQLQESSRLLLAFGFAAEDVLPMMTAIGNAAAGLGVGAEGIDRAVRALGQMRAKGKVSAEEIMQLTEIGIPAYDILQKKFGLSAKQMDNLGKAGISADAAIKALVEGMNERFKDMMKNQSVSLFGLGSTIKDIFNMQILYRWGEGLRQAIQPRVLRLVEWFEQNGDTVERWGNTLERTAREAGEALMRNLESAFGYIRARYLDNPEFQQLDFAGKVNFVIDDLTAVFDTWWNGPGGAKVRDLGSKLGSSFINSMGKAALEAVLNHPLLALLVGGYLGLATPGPLTVKITVALSLLAAGEVLKILNWLAERSPLNPEPKIRQQLEAWETFEKRRATAPKAEPLFGGQSIVPAHAFGGIYSRPHIGLFAEAGPEALIPLSGRMRNRGIDLWYRVGSILGTLPMSPNMSGFAGPMPVAVPATANVGGFGRIITGPINVTLNVTASEGQDVLQVIRANYRVIANEVAEVIAEGVKSSYQNMPK